MSDIIKELDFSKFHDLGHKWFSSYCRAQPGGWKRHINLWWTYLAKDRMYKNTLHRLGKHYPVERLNQEGKLPKHGGTGITIISTGEYECWYCGKSL